MGSDSAVKDFIVFTNLEGVNNLTLNVFTQHRAGMLNCLAVRLYWLLAMAESFPHQTQAK